MIHRFGRQFAVCSKGAARGVKATNRASRPAVRSYGFRAHPQLEPSFNVHEHLWVDSGETLRSSMKLQNFGIDPVELGVASDHAVTKPFRLLSPDAVSIINDELKRIGPSCTFQAPPFAPCVMRGVTHYSRFIDQLWSSPELSALLSAVSGVALKPHPMKLERAHVNIQKAHSSTVPAAGAPVANQSALEVEAPQPVFDWHLDSQPFVCIVMLSDPPDDAIGGQTMVRTPNNQEEFGLTFPQAGYAYFMQGSVLPHCAMPAVNYNRVTMITSFVFADPLLSEKTDMGLAAHYTPTDQLRAEYASYRLEAAANKANALKARLRVNVRKNTFNTDLAIAELDKIAADIAHTRNSLEAVRSTTGPSGFGSMESHPYSELHSLTTY